MTTERHTSPLQWPWALSATPTLSSETTGWERALVRRWSGTSPVMVQPALDQHYVVMHLGGAKYVARQRDGAPISTIAACGSLTFVPAGTAYTWRTVGPIAFAHLYLHPHQLEDVITDEFDCEGRGTTLTEQVGFRDRLLEPLFARMIDECESRACASTLRLDCLFEHFMVRLARNHASRKITARFRSMPLAPHRLQRVLDFIDENLDRDIGLADLVAAAGSSQSHFSHAFHAATGSSPYRYLIARRIDYAKVLLLTGREPMDFVSARCGFNSSHQFAVMFKRAVGMGPKRFSMKGHGRSTSPAASSTPR